VGIDDDTIRDDPGEITVPAADLWLLVFLRGRWAEREDFTRGMRLVLKRAGWTTAQIENLFRLAKAAAQEP